jgi:hypothetical protein
MPNVPYSYEVNGKLVTGNGSLIPICSLSNSSLLPSLTVSDSILVFFCFYLGHHSMTNDLVSTKKDLYCNFVFPNNSSLVLGPEL